MSNLLNNDNPDYRKLSGVQKETLHNKVAGGIKKLNLIGLKAPVQTDLDRLLMLSCDRISQARARINSIHDAAQSKGLNDDRHRANLWDFAGKAFLEAFRDYTKEELLIILAKHFSDKVMEEL